MPERTTTVPMRGAPADKSREPFLGAPTWARRHVGLGQYERLVLEPRPRRVERRQQIQVWAIPPAASSPGDRIEIGPLPAGVRVDVEIDHPFAPAPAEVPW